MGTFEMIKHIFEGLLSMVIIGFMKIIAVSPFSANSFETIKFCVDTALTIGTVLVAAIAVIQGNKNSRRHNELIRKLNSKEHEMSENLKYEVYELIAVLRSIDAKAANGTPVNDNRYYVYEMEVLQRLQSKPEFLLFLRSIETPSERFSIESLLSTLVNFATSTSNSGRIEDTHSKIRDEVHVILETLKRQFNPEAIDYNIDWKCLVVELCEMSGIYTKYYDSIMNRQILNRFIDYLKNIKNTEDPFLNSVTLLEHQKDKPFDGYDKRIQFFDSESTIKDFSNKYMDDYEKYYERLVNDFKKYMVKKGKDMDGLNISSNEGTDSIFVTYRSFFMEFCENLDKKNNTQMANVLGNKEETSNISILN